MAIDKKIVELPSEVNISNVIAIPGVNTAGKNVRISGDDIVSSLDIDLLIQGTYSEIKALKDAGELIIGTKYLITDFRTRYTINKQGTDIETFEGPIEPLVVTANSTSEFSDDAFSILYPKDEIKYTFDTFDMLAYLTAESGGDENIAKQIINSITFLATNADKGYITYRKDPRIQTSAYYDWRHRKFRRWEHPTRAGLYTELDDNGGNYIDTYTFYNVSDPYSELIELNPDDYRFFNNSIGIASKELNNQIANNIVFYCVSGIPTEVQFTDNVFNGLERCSFTGREYYQNTINNKPGRYSGNIHYPQQTDITRSFMYGNYIEECTILNNQFDAQTSNNVFIQTQITSNEFVGLPSFPTSSCNFSENTFNKAFFNNNKFESTTVTGNAMTLGSFLNNTITGPRIKNNVIDGTIYNCDFTGNWPIGAFEENTITARCNLMQNCTISIPNQTHNFRYNTIECRNLSGVNWGSSTTQHVRQPSYNKKLTTRLDGTQVLQYTDNAGAIVSVSITA